MSKTIRRTPKEFLRLARREHGDRYEYPEPYVRAAQKIRISCTEHGDFEMWPQSHLLGSGCPDCKTGKKPNGYWTKERCQEKAQLCQTRMEFQSRFAGAYDKSYSLGWLDEIGAHWNTFSVPNGHWTEDVLRVELLKYGSREELRLANSSAYSAVHNHQLQRLFDEVYGPQKSHEIKWTFDKARAEFLKHKTRQECHQHANGAYQAAFRQGFLFRALKGIPNAKGGFDHEKPAIVYYLRLHTGQFKIGITNRTVKKRYVGETHLFDVICVKRFDVGMDAQIVEDHILSHFKHLRYEGPPLLSSGNTEIFVTDILSLDAEAA
ncbi:hypothetical protein [Ruegeria arenilitoris]|uniref:hypothetical protein n=1 Tax=Ruegeria arenilitoris TaxID=1173585 RepID=UPI00147D0FEC|nr:hypothetical protein [Ruegeria arenilitoris]